MVLRVVNKLYSCIKEFREIFNKENEYVLENQSEINIIMEMKNRLEGIDINQ